MSKLIASDVIEERLIDFGIGGVLGEFIELAQGIEDGCFTKFRPIYGFGTALAYREGSLIKRFMMNLFIAVAVEYIGSVIFDASKTKWDYSHMKYNFEGRVCLKYSLIFALGMTIYSYFPREVKPTYLAGCVMVHVTRLAIDHIPSE
jgi:hypothetical protein